MKSETFQNSDGFRQLAGANSKWNLQVASSELWINVKQFAAQLQSFNQKNIQCDTTPIIKLSTEEQAAMTKTKGLFGLYVGFTILPIVLSWY